MKVQLLAAMVLGGCASAPRPAPSVSDPLLDAWAQAAGGRDRLGKLGTVHVSGRIEQGGMKGRLDVWHDASGRRREELELGGVERSITVYDGKSAFRSDRNRFVRELDGPEIAEQIALAYLDGNAAILGGRPGSVAHAGEGLELRPQGGRPLTVRFDAATHLPATVSRPEAEKVNTTTYSDWREVGGVRFPFAVKDDDGDPRNARVFTVEKVTLDEAAPAFARPAAGPPDFHFVKGSEASMPFESVHQLIIVETRVNGHEPMSFIVDTGAEVTVLNKSRLARLGLTPVGEIGEGAGGGNVELSFVRGVSLAVQGVELTDQIVTAIPLDGLEGPFGHKIDGVLGYDFISRFVMTVDYEKKMLTVADPATAKKPAGVAVPMTLQGNTPTIRAQVELAKSRAGEGLFVIDTGCTCEINVSAPFTQAHGLIAALPRVVTPPSGSSLGAGGETKSVMGRLDAFRIGELRVARPIASFSTDTVGAMTDPDSAGLIGGTLLGRYTVTFDYGRKTMWLARNASSEKASDMRTTGAVWTATGSSIIVAAVIDGSPAAEVGLAQGDTLVTLDGKPAANLGAVTQTLGEGKHTVVVDRGGKKMSVELAARDLL